MGERTLPWLPPPRDAAEAKQQMRELARRKREEAGGKAR